jgi:hypothetical protein
MTERQKLIAAVWMVGNIDTDEDRRSWWNTFGPLWQSISDNEPEAQIWADQMFAHSTQGAK